MDPKTLYISVGVILLGIIAGSAFITQIDNTYGSSVSTSIQTVNQTKSIFNSTISSFGLEIGDSINPVDGQGIDEGSAGLAQRGWTIISSLPELLGIIPTAMRDAALALGIPSEYTSIAIYIFIGVFSITIAYLLILGVRSIIRG